MIDLLTLRKETTHKIYYHNNLGKNMKLAKILLILSLICMSALSVSAGEADYVKGDLIVQVTGSGAELSLTNSFKSNSLHPVRLLSKRMNIWLFQYDASAMKTAQHKALLAEVRNHSAVEIAQFNHYIKERATFPNDPSFNNKWELNNTGQSGGTVDADIDAVEAWDITTGDTTVFGDQIVVAVVDGGCDLTHPDIDYFKNIHEVPGNGIDDDGNGYIDDYDGWDAYANDGTVPSNDHGTHVAGIAAAIGNNNTGVVGVNWGVKVMPVAGSTSQEAVAVAAYSYVHEMRALYNQTNGALGAFVVATNSSFGVDYGNPANFPLWCAMYDSLGAVGVLSMAATANLNIDIDVQGDVPTACASDYLISVTNTTDTDSRNSGAAYGTTTIDLGAPGTSIYSSLQGGGYGYKTGTSMATPQVCGAVAFMYGVGCTNFLQQAKLDPATIALFVKQAILNGTDPISALAGITVSGGRLNLYNSALLVQAYPCGVAINHTPLTDTRDTLNDYHVVASITSDTTLVADSLKLHYQVSGVWTSMLLSPTINPDEYEGFIPAQQAGTIIDYYLTAGDVAGKVDTTPTFQFSVIEYAMTLSPQTATNFGPVDDTVWYDFVLVNTGVYADDYTLSVTNNTWPSVLYDATGINPISSSGNMFGDDTVLFKLRVIIPTSLYGDLDTAVVTATSTGNPLISSASSCITTSDGQPLTVPFTENFPTTTIDNGKWVLISGATSNDIGLNEPSPAYSANLNGNPSGADSMMTQAIDLKNEINVVVSYWYQQTGGGDTPEAGDDLFVEGLDSLGVWQLLQQHFGGNPDMTSYAEVSMTLPSTMIHSGFRLRFRCTATAGSFDDWFVDDIYVGPPPPYAVELTPQTANQFGPAGDTVSYLFTVVNKGVNADDYVLSASSATWPAFIYDETGTTQISNTGIINPASSFAFMVKVAIDAGAIMNTNDTALVVATSVGDASVLDYSVVVTYSAGAPGGFPWYEPFPFDTLFTARWLTAIGVEVNVEGTNPPSALYAMNVDGGNDTAVTQIMDITGQTDVILSYYYQRGGSGEPPDAGDDLTVEYKNNVGTWMPVAQHLGAEPTMSNFQQVNFNLPADAMHSAFQVRFHTVGSGALTDDWYIDDIRVDHAPLISATPLAFSEILPIDDSTTDKLYISNLGLGALQWSASVIPNFSKYGRFAELLNAGLVEPSRRKYPEGFHIYDDKKGSIDPREGFPVLRNAGGPDAFGYFWVDSDELGGPTFNWIDVSGTGTDVVVDLNDDNYGGPYPIGFTFNFYGNDYTEIYIGSNGIIGFDSTTMSSRFKTALPTATTPNNILAWLWDDLNPDDADNPNAHVYIDTNSSRCIIQFVDYSEYAGNAGDVVTAQVILEPNGDITYQYKSIATGFDIANCAVGLENFDGSDGIEVAYLTTYLHDSLAIQFSAPYQWLTLDNINGYIGGSETDTLTLSYNSTGMDVGTYNATIALTSNDVATGTISMPVSLQVTDTPAYICGDVNGSGVLPITVDDLTYLVAFLFQSGPQPPVPASADCDGSGGLINVDDLTYLVAYLFQSGPPPICGG